MVQADGRMFERRYDVLHRLGGLIERVLMRPEPVEVVAQRYNFLPQRFRWRGNLWRVRQVVRMWNEAATPLAPPRRFFQVLCHDGGDRILFQDLRLGTWHVSV